MKRIFCFILCVLTLVPLFALWPSAETTVDVVGQLQNYTIDGKPFDPNDYPLNTSDKGIYLLALRERGSVRGQEPSEWKNYKLDLYLYNPSGIPIEDGTGTLLWTYSEEVDPEWEWGEHTFASNATYYSVDYRFVRVTVPFTSARPIPTGDKRIFHFYELRFNHVIGTGTDTTLEAVINDTECVYTVYGFESDGTMSYSDGQTRTMELELRGTAWRAENPKSELTPNIYTEIPSVYFTIPSEIYNNYDRVAQIAANFWMFHSKPIVLTNSSSFDAKYADYLKAGVDYAGFTDSLPMLSYGKLKYLFNQTFVTPEWVYNPNTYTQSLCNYVKERGGSSYNKFVEYGNHLNLYFYRQSIAIDDESNHFHLAVSDAEFESYLQGYTDAYYSDFVGPLLGGIAPDLYESSYRHEEVYSYNNPETGKDDDETTYKLTDYNFTGNLKWWDILGLFGGVAGAETVDKICEITSPAAVASEYANNLDGLCDKYKIGKDDAASFLSYLQNADGVVVLLRLDAVEYECHELNVSPAIDDGQAWLVEMNFYREVDVTEVTFEKDGKLTTYKVIADPININGGVGVKNDPRPVGSLTMIPGAISNWWKGLTESGEALSMALKMFMGVAIVAVVVFAVIKVAGLFKSNKITIEYPPDKRKRK
ncbi:MAG: hypothetical protein IJY50_03640 [Clostridia bacterium]|nr:hypothetical protein [Clostridia bacterium]